MGKEGRMRGCVVSLIRLLISRSVLLEEERRRAIQLVQVEVITLPPRLCRFAEASRHRPQYIASCETSIHSAPVQRSPVIVRLSFRLARRRIHLHGIGMFAGSVRGIGDAVIRIKIPGGSCTGHGSPASRHAKES
jgi:hypothetical protein